MQVLLGNPHPHRCVVDPVLGHVGHERVDLHGAPATTALTIPEGDGGYSLELPDGFEEYSDSDVHSLVAEAALHLAQHPDITQLPGLEPLLVAAHPGGGCWNHHSEDTPSWVWSDNGAYEKLLSSYYGCPAGVPDDLEDTHWTRFGAPGVGAWGLKPQAILTDDGRTLWAQSLGGGQVGAVGAGTTAGVTSLTTASTFTTNQWAGYRVYVYSTIGTLLVWGNVKSNTNAAGASVLNVDRWYNAATPGGAAAATPTTPWSFIIADGGCTSAWFVGLSTTVGVGGTAPAHGDHSLAGEITAQPAGLLRKIAPFALTSGVSPASYTLTPVYTVGGGDTSLPTTVIGFAVFNSMVAADTTLSMMFETALNAAFTVNLAGDQATLTETVTGS